MATIYARWILAGKITIDDVPARWQEQVRTMLEGGGNDNDQS